MPDVTISYGTSYDFIAFFGCFHKFMSEVIYLHQTFINCVFDMSINILL